MALPRTVVVALTFAVLLAFEYLPATRATFVYEDDSAILQTVVNDHAPIAPWRIRALTRLSYRFDNWIGHGEPWAFHLTNVLLHGLNGLLVAWIAWRLGLGGWGQAMAAAIFLFHPIQTEAVAYAAGRTEVLSTVFVLVAIGLTISRWDAAWRWWEGIASWRVACAIAALVLAMSAKESAVAGLGLVAYAIGVFHPRWYRQRSVRVACVAVLAVAVALTVTVLRREHLAIADGGRLAYAALQATAVWRYLLLVVVPWGQSVDHDLLVVPAFWRGVAGYVLASCAILVMLLWPLRDWIDAVHGYSTRRRIWIAVFAVGWVGIALVPRFLMRIPEVLNEHQLYLAMAGIAWLVGVACDRAPALTMTACHYTPSELPYA